MQLDITVRCPVCGSEHALAATPEHATVVICCSRAIIASQKTAWGFPDSPEFEVKVVGHPDYELRMYISQGANGVVISAFHRILERLVALKIAKLCGLSDIKLELLAARKTAQLRHAAIPTVYDVTVFRDELSGNDYRVVVMDLVEGLSLSRVSDEQLREFNRYLVFQNLCAALRDCHTAGLYHGDLESFDNILVGKSSEVYLIDFGFSRRLDGSGQIAGFMQSDLRAVLGASRRLFHSDLPVQIATNDDILSLQKKVEKAVGDHHAAENRVYSMQKRWNYVNDNDWRMLPFRIISQHIVMQIGPNGHTQYRIERLLEPFVPLRYFDHICTFDSLTTQAELGFCALLSTDTGFMPLRFVIDRSVESAYETLFHVRVDFDTPLAPNRSDLVVVEYSCTSCMDPNADGYSYDVTAYLNELKVTFTFSGSAGLPLKWTGKKQPRPDGSLFEEVPSAESCVLDAATSTATWLFRDLRPPSSLHIRYSR